MCRYKTGMQITISFVHCTVDCSTKFPKDDVPKCLVCPQLKDVQLTVIEEERKQRIFTFKMMMGLENFECFLFRKSY